jgi:hypothetical protein
MSRQRELDLDPVRLGERFPADFTWGFASSG